MSNIQKDFGNKVRQIRKSLHMSQEELALKSGLHRNYICDLERGARNVSLKAIEQLALGLGVSISTLFEK